MQPGTCSDGQSGALSGYEWSHNVCNTNNIDAVAAACEDQVREADKILRKSFDREQSAMASSGSTKKRSLTLDVVECFSYTEKKF